MIEIDARDRALHFSQPKRRYGAVVAIIVILIACLAAGIFYWRTQATYSEVYRQLNISSLPITIEFQSQIYNRIDQLRREPCYKDAVIGLSDALIEAGYPRESALSLGAFAERCRAIDDEDILDREYDAFSKMDDFSAALRAASRLINSHPANPLYRYYRGSAYEHLRNFSSALADYTATLQLLGAPDSVAGSEFYRISRMYAALGRYCDAITPMETFVSYCPLERRTPDVTKIITEYAQKGACETHYARGFATVSFLNSTGLRVLTVTVKGVNGNFILDSGAELVTVTPEFSARAKIKNEGGSQIPLRTAGGSGTADLGYADTISVGNAEAQGVAVATIEGSNDPFGSKLDGLLGMSFLARFSVRMSQDGVGFKAIPLQ
jgi:predicted aspartyl protease